VGGWHTCIQPTVLVCSVISQMNTVQLHAQAQWNIRTDWKAW